MNPPVGTVYVCEPLDFVEVPPSPNDQEYEVALLDAAALKLTVSFPLEQVVNAFGLTNARAMGWGAGVGLGVGLGVGFAVGFGVAAGVALGVGTAVGTGVTFGVTRGVGGAVTGGGEGLGAGVATGAGVTATVELPAADGDATATMSVSDGDGAGVADATPPGNPGTMTSAPNTIATPTNRTAEASRYSRRRRSDRGTGATTGTRPGVSPMSPMFDIRRRAIWASSSDGRRTGRPGRADDTGGEEAIGEAADRT